MPTREETPMDQAVFDSTVTPSPRTGLFFDSQAGDYIGWGR